ncbi:MAG: class IV adenylate cyclase [Candidatus Hydrogenedentes bacterium]|nr:class IV adenylate cyclase [Candidatus Hydrogenedentota bacterium]
MRNIELKARLRDVIEAVGVCRAVGAVFQGDIRQVDTYFNTPTGRLKLRENEPGATELIHYHRANTADSKGSDYEIVPASAALRDMLAHALGVVAVVRKIRGLWRWDNVRIHLDTVEGLGAFIEFEAVLDDRHDDAGGHAKIQELRGAFGIGEEDLVAVSYKDLIG